ncbi:ribbon-helix-helix domain-containing protein [bacterium]|nr:ribbon-helix-helix domain-containing protein [bacterium]
MSPLPVSTMDSSLMPAKRFQIYLEPDQYKKIKAVSISNNITMAAVIRKALDQYLQHPNQKNHLANDPLWSIIGITRKISGDSK